MLLYQMPISHYCEKVRWALDFKGIRYEVKNLLPGLHVPVIRKLTQSTSTSIPLLVHGERVIQNSSDIIDYLDQAYPKKPLLPKDMDENSIRDWEEFADELIGPHVRRCCYHVLLGHKQILVPMFAQNGPFYSKAFLNLAYSKLVKIMRESMRLNDQGFTESKQELDQAIKRLRVHLKERKFLVGDRFTRADLAVAALLAPLSRAEGYGIVWPEMLPPVLDEMAKEYKDILDWVNSIYREYR